MPLRSTGFGAALVGFVLALVHFSPGYVSQQLADGEWNWLPELETVGQTVVVYNYVSRGVAFVLAIGAVFALGYWAGTRLDLRADYQRFVLAIGLGGLFGYVVALALFVLLTTDGSVLMDDPVLAATSLLARSIGVALEFAVVGFAGAAFAAFISERGSDGEPATSRGDSSIHAGSYD